MTIIERYRQGDRQQAWNMATALGPRALEAPYEKEIEELSATVVNRAVANLHVLRKRLTDLGYRFANPEWVLVEAGADSQQAIHAVEARLGRLPTILRAWYHRVTSVDFRQAECQLRMQAEEASVAGLGLNNSLFFLPLAQWLQLKNEIDMRLSAAGGGKLEEGFLPLGSDASNSEPKGFLLPCHAADGVYYNDGSGDVGFVAELRRCFAYGGFPFWASMLGRKRRLMFAPTPRDLDAIIGQLAAGLEPI